MSVYTTLGMTPNAVYSKIVSIYLIIVSIKSTILLLSTLYCTEGASNNKHFKKKKRSLYWRDTSGTTMFIVYYIYVYVYGIKCNNNNNNNTIYRLWSRGARVVMFYRATGINSGAEGRDGRMKFWWWEGKGINDRGDRCLVAGTMIGHRLRWRRGKGRDRRTYM